MTDNVTQPSSYVAQLEDEFTMLQPATSAPTSPPPLLALSIGTYVRHNRGEIKPSAGLSIDERALEMQAHLGFDQSILSHLLDPSSLRIYCRDFYAYLEFAGTAEQACYPAKFAQWINHLARAKKPGSDRGYSAATINRMAAAVRKTMKEASRQGYVHPLTAKAFQEVEGASERGLKENQRPHNRVEIKADAMREMTDLANGDRLLELRNRAILFTLASTGLRVDTFRQLRLDQIVHRESDWAFHIRSKNEVKFRDVPMSDEAYSAIQAWLAARPKNSAYIFTHFEGGKSESNNARLSDKPLSSVSIWRIVKRYGAEVGLVDPETLASIIKPHDFRRFVGTRIAKKRGPKQAQLQLGHKHIATTLDNYVLEEPEAGVTNDLF
ncbi:MAG: tyrosine-type recombinase/integrase [Ktedonobacteraceae bacterium]